MKHPAQTQVLPLSPGKPEAYTATTWVHTTLWLLSQWWVAHYVLTRAFVYSTVLASMQTLTQHAGCQQSIRTAQSYTTMQVQTAVRFVVVSATVADKGFEQMQVLNSCCANALLIWSLRDDNQLFLHAKLNHKWLWGHCSFCTHPHAQFNVCFSMGMLP